MENLMLVDEVCEYLDISRGSLEDIIRRDKKLPNGETFKPKYKLGNTRYFDREDVQAYRENYMSERGYSIADIAKLYGLSEGQVRYRMTSKRNVEPDWFNGIEQRFSEEKVRMVAEAEGWTRNEK